MLKLTCVAASSKPCTFANSYIVPLRTASQRRLGNLLPFELELRPLNLLILVVFDFFEVLGLLCCVWVLWTLVFRLFKS